ncbi:MAG: ABC transporter permease [Candidatus Hodarchaeota archaeon]
MKGERIWWTLAGLTLVLVLWEVVVRVFNLPWYLVVPPSEVFSEIAERNVVLLPHLYRTLFGTFVGLALAILLGVSLGLLIGYSQTLTKLFFPILGSFSVMPKQIILPILVVWLGLGSLPGLMIALLIAFFPICVNVVTGLATIPSEQWEMLRTLGASKIQVFLKVGLPRTVPYIFAALKLASSGAFIGEVVSEMIASDAGLGYVIVIATARLDMRLAYSSVLILILLGYVIFSTFDELDKKIAPWAYRGMGST